AEIPHLRLPAAVIARELMHEHHGRTRARLLVIKPDAVVGGEVGHGWSSRARAPRSAAAMSEAAVDGDDGAGGVGGKIRGKECRHGGDLLRRRRATERQVLAELT